MSCSRPVTVHVVDADLKSYFDTIPHDRLLALVAEKVSDGRVLALIEAFLSQASWTACRNGRRSRARRKAR